jgi:hypothetical protein
VTDALEVVVADAGYWHKKQMGSPRGVGGALSATRTRWRHCCSRADAVVCGAAHETPGQDELQSSRRWLGRCSLTPDEAVVIASLASAPPRRPDQASEAELSRRSQSRKAVAATKEPLALDVTRRAVLQAVIAGPRPDSWPGRAPPIVSADPDGSPQLGIPGPGSN